MAPARGRRRNHRDDHSDADLSSVARLGLRVAPSLSRAQDRTAPASPPSRIVAHSSVGARRARLRGRACVRRLDSWNGREDLPEGALEVPDPRGASSTRRLRRVGCGVQQRRRDPLRRWAEHRPSDHRTGDAGSTTGLAYLGRTRRSPSRHRRGNVARHSLTYGKSLRGVTMVRGRARAAPST
jgi:hypothetical protein